MRFLISSFLVILASFHLAACSGSSGSGEFEQKDYPRERVAIPEEVMAFYQEHPEFFVFATPEDLPDDLEWQNGEQLDEIGSPEAKKGGTFYMFMNDFPRTLRFVGPEANGAFRRYMLDHNALHLTTPHPNNPVEHFAELAESWAVGDDGKTVYYKLDPDATYSDGVPVRADDYMYLFYWMRSEWITDPWYNDNYSKKFAGITKYDDLTIAVRLPEAKPDLLYRARIRPLPMHFYTEFADDYIDYYQWQMEPTTGAYEIKPENIKKGKSITLTKVENWWARDMKNFRYRFNPDAINVRVVRDLTKAWELFVRGELDAAYMRMPEQWYDKMPDNHPFVKNGYLHKAVFYNEIPRPTWALRINRHKPLLDNRDIRVGLHYACNWDLVLEQVFQGDYTRMHTVADGFGATSHPTIRAREFSPEKAAAQFAKAGFTKKGGDGIFVNDKGQRLSFTITTGYKRLENVLTVLQEEAKKAGVDFQVEMLELTAGWKKADEKAHEIVLTARNVSVELYPRFWEGYHSSNAYEDDGETLKTDTNNETVTSSKELDAMIDAYRKADNLDEITKLSHSMIEWLHNDGAYIPGFVMPWYRLGYWRWVGWPDDFNVRTSRDWEEFRLFWIDEEKKKETLEAMKSGQTFPKSVEVYDQFFKE